VHIRGNKNLISILQVGTVDYAAGLRLQQQLVALRKEEKIGDILLLLEHKPVITLGRNAKAANIIASPEFLAQRGVELFKCDRGGDVTFHGPGQLLGYPIFDLRGHARGAGTDYGAADALVRRGSAPSAERKHLGAVDFVRRLEEVLIRTSADFAIPAKRIPGLTGVWTDSDSSSYSNPLSFRAKENDSKNRSLESRNLPSAGAPTNATPEAKLAAIGIHISRSVTSHGFALNVNTDLSFFNLIVPCGITTKPVTSMQQQLARGLDLNAVAQSISRNFGVVFQSQILWLESLDALLGHSYVGPGL
jgi:lipoyl(octanoyl) transferase